LKTGEMYDIIKEYSKECIESFFIVALTGFLRKEEVLLNGKTGNVHTTYVRGVR